MCEASLTCRCEIRRHEPQDAPRARWEAHVNAVLDHRRAHTNLGNVAIGIGFPVGDGQVVGMEELPPFDGQGPEAPQVDVGF